MNLLILLAGPLYFPHNMTPNQTTQTKTRRGTNGLCLGCLGCILSLALILLPLPKAPKRWVVFLFHRLGAFGKWFGEDMRNGETRRVEGPLRAWKVGETSEQSERATKEPLIFSSSLVSLATLVSPLSPLCLFIISAFMVAEEGK